MTEGSTAMIKGQEVRVGDDLWSMGTPHRITRIEPYAHPVVTRGEQWRQACSDGPEGVGKAAWGITLEFAHGWAPGHYKVSLLPGDERGEPHLSADDYLSPFGGAGARLYEHYAAAGFPGTWRAWLESAGRRGLLAGPRPGVPDFANGAGDRFRWDPELMSWGLLRCVA